MIPNVNRYLDFVQIEGISSTARKGGEQVGKKIKPFSFFAGKAAKGVATAAGKTAILGTKLTAKGIWGTAKVVGQSAKGIAKTPGNAIKNVKKVNRVIKNPPSPFSLAKSYKLKLLNKMKTRKK